jgi:hypothetical protein
MTTFFSLTSTSVAATDVKQRSRSVSPHTLRCSLLHQCLQCAANTSCGILNVAVMRRMMTRDASALAQALLSPTAKDLEDGIDICQAVGLEKHVNPFQRRRAQKAMIRQKHAVVSLQDEVQDEHELRCISERFSCTSSTRTHTLAVHWMVMGAH